MNRYIAFFILATLAVSLVACGGSPTAPAPVPPPVPPPVTTTAPPDVPVPPVISAVTRFEGTLAGTGNQSGVYTVEIATGVAAVGADRVGRASIVSAGGTLTLINGGGAFTLVGSFDTTTGALTLSGGGFAMAGAVGQGELVGTYTGPGGSAGRFAALDATRNTVTVLCGTWTGSGGPGTWNLQVSSNGSASGVTTGGAGVTLRGQLTGTALTMTSSQGVNASGVVQDGRVTGTFPGGAFTGSADGCR